ncbi:hypothetical protein BOX15_Mlig010768g1 [Macrostomum lignano]|uniref:Uncharacterized protein n=1 Tax=Macrostomum lignano TaxID=282301 RepID=A0A267F4N0_9PLAT|nr:hypothetical protein BOX15_Mlig010768g1 [Macrostomum lignano]
MRTQSFIAIYFILLTIVSQFPSGGQCCPKAVKSLKSRAKSFFKLKSAKKAGDAPGNANRKSSVTDMDNPGCKNPFFPCNEGGLVKSVGKKAGAAQKGKSKKSADLDNPGCQNPFLPCKKSGGFFKKAGGAIGPHKKKIGFIGAGAATTGLAATGAAGIALSKSGKSDPTAQTIDPDRTGLAGGAKAYLGIDKQTA